MSRSEASAGKQPQQAQSSTSPSRTRQLVSTACGACREKRVKCDGPPAPCEACLHRKTECVFNINQDQRRRLARKHKVDETEFHKNLLHGLLETIRSTNASYTQDVIMAIRNNASMDEVMGIIDRNLALARQQGVTGNQATENLQGLRNEAKTLQRLSDNAVTRRKGATAGSFDSESAARQLPDVRSRSSSGTSAGGEVDGRRGSADDRDHRRVMAIQELVDTQPWFQVPASPWTAVTDSDELVSHLVSLYFAWWNAHLHALDRRSFISAMKSQDVTNPLCSPFLVNAVLAVASQLCVFPRVFSESGDLSDRGTAFHNEAQRLWHEEHGRTSLTNMQGVLALLSSMYIRGKDRAGWLYLSQLVQMHNDLSLSEKIPQTFFANPSLNEDVQQSFRNVAWANFNMSVQFSFSILKIVSVDAPKWGMPFSERQKEEWVEWTPYPSPGPSRNYREYKAYNALCDLLKRAWRVRDLLKHPGSLESTLSLDDVEDVIADLKNWRAGIPECVVPSSTAPAPAFSIIMAYYWIQMTLQYFMMDREGSSPQSQNSSSTNSYQTERTRELIFEVLPIHRNYHRMYGYSQLPWLIVQTALIGCNTLLRGLRTDEDQSAFSQLSDTLIAGGRKWPLWMGTVLMLRPTARELGVQLPEESDAKLRAFEDSIWTPELPQRFSSVFPNYAFAKDVSVAKRDDNYEMGQLLDHWSALHFGKDTE